MSEMCHKLPHLLLLAISPTKNVVYLRATTVTMAADRRTRVRGIVVARLVTSNQWSTHMLTARIAKSLAKRVLPKRIKGDLRILRRLIGYVDYPQVPFDNTYAWLNWAFSQVSAKASPLCKSRPQYIWASLKARPWQGFWGRPEFP